MFSELQRLAGDNVLLNKLEFPRVMEHHRVHVTAALSHSLPAMATYVGTGGLETVCSSGHTFVRRPYFIPTFPRIGCTVGFSH